ncbi:MAG TPA: hypothetical protein VN634_08590 [Candidatus Limnocylindrales bacterium]|nr:hypothetical protein [Candidatus Limnocylindrales bacterium]
MSPIKILAILLILAGAGGLAYGQFTYTEESHDAKIGPIELSIKDNKTVRIPQWLAAVAVGGGVLMLMFDRKQT